MKSVVIALSLAVLSTSAKASSNEEKVVHSENCRVMVINGMSLTTDFTSKLMAFLRGT